MHNYVLPTYQELSPSVIFRNQAKDIKTDMLPVGGDVIGTLAIFYSTILHSYRTLRSSSDMSVLSVQERTVGTAMVEFKS